MAVLSILRRQNYVSDSKIAFHSPHSRIAPALLIPRFRQMLKAIANPSSRTKNTAFVQKLYVNALLHWWRLSSLQYSTISSKPHQPWPPPKTNSALTSTLTNGCQSTDQYTPNKNTEENSVQGRMSLRVKYRK
ncbi:hypothetical protein AA313_de0207905 [Arthrobotrys entomopaga]|nr:hypothetical protein AA313_de0207905 [Arthrobotrys entomopaga]